MSTTFDIIPGKAYIPSLEEVVEHANIRINQFLKGIGIKDDIKLKVQLRKKDENKVIGNILCNKAKWDDDYYAWFFIEGISGGTDAYFWNFDSIDLDCWKEEIESNERACLYRNRINKGLELGYYWNFRRSAGQPGIITLSYGIIAASLCTLTDGLIYSNDGAWNYSLFPATAEEFFSQYFKPEEVLEQDEKEWVISCIRSIQMYFRDKASAKWKG